MIERRNLTPEQHLARLQDWLRRSEPSIDSCRLRYFEDGYAVLRQRQWCVHRERVGSESGLMRLLDRLIQEQRPWINLCGVGRLTEGVYLVQVEYSTATGVGPPSVALSGPYHQPPGRPPHELPFRFVGHDGFASGAAGGRCKR